MLHPLLDMLIWNKLNQISINLKRYGSLTSIYPRDSRSSDCALDNKLPLPILISFFAIWGGRYYQILLAIRMICGGLFHLPFKAYFSLIET